nr:carboxypeptidase inhibitor SmCI-like [Dermacentor andersoni]
MKLFLFLALLGTALAATNFEKQCGPKAVVGICRARLPRYWFNKETGECELFYYGGCGGNENRYLTQEKCEETCLDKKPIQKSYIADEAYIGITDELMAAAANSVCRKPPHPGPCMGSFPRFYYDQKTNSCRLFLYGGCDSNGNNFESPIDCMRLCGSPKPGEPMPRRKEEAATNFEKQCGSKAEVGICKALLPRYWFNKETGECELFYYGGCGGNENRYLTQEKCEETCLDKKPIQKSHVADEAYIGITDELMAGAANSVCRKPPHPGPCMGSFPRFYYDQKTNTCRLFLYGGCDSNGNNFESPIDCMRLCGSTKPGFPMPRVA